MTTPNKRPGQYFTIPDSRATEIAKMYLVSRSLNREKRSEMLESTIDGMASVIAAMFGIQESRVEELTLLIEQQDRSLEMMGLALKNVLIREHYR